MVCTKVCVFLLLVNVFTTILCQTHLLIDQLRLDFLDLEDRLWKYVLWEAPINNRDGAELYLIENFNDFDRKLKQMPDDILRGLEPVRSTKAFLFLYSELKSTKNLYDKFRKFREDRQKVSDIGFNDKRTLMDTIQLEDVIRDILHPKTGTNASINNVYNMTFGKENIAMEVFEILERNFQCKNYFQSPQQVFYNLYNTIALNSLKSYIMLQFSYLASRIGEKGNYAELSTLAQKEFETRVNETMSVFKGAMTIMPQNIWRCDPPNHIKGYTYTEITRLLQGHVQNEVDMNPGGTCTNNCDSYPSSTNHGCYDGDSQYCREMERCAGKLTACRFVESHMNICVSRVPSRRYDYVQYDSGKTMGRISHCRKKPVSSWWRWFVHCSYCMCLCDEHGPKSDRYFNMRPVMADTKNNRVVTGLRFVKHNRIIHLQIQEGKLLPYGYIHNATVHWVRVNDYKITDKNPEVFDGIDYFTLTSDNRSLALDDVIGNPGMLNHVVTGVGFVYDKMWRLQLLTRPFDWENGSVSQLTNSTMYISSGGKHQIDLNNADLPNYSPRTEKNYDVDTYVKFTHTGFDQDAAQTTIPFIDMQPVYSNPPVPLKGVGLYFKGKTGYGGFIAPTIMTYNFAPLMNMNSPRVKTGE